MSLSGHQSAAAVSVEWLTPPEILRRLGEFDLDPYCPPVMPWSTAKTMLTREHDGLAVAWRGRVWLNPPFGSEAAHWLKKLADHGDGIALIPARTETKMFFRHVWSGASSVLFVEGRPHFHRPDGTRASFNSGAPICLVGYGKRNDRALEDSMLGQFIRLNSAASPDVQEVSA